MTVQIQEALERSQLKLQRSQLVYNFLKEADSQAISDLLEALKLEPNTEIGRDVEAVPSRSIESGPQVRGEVRNRLQHVFLTHPIEQALSVNECLTVLDREGFVFQSSHLKQHKSLVRRSLNALAKTGFLKIVDKGGGGRPVQYRRVPRNEGGT